MSLTLAAGATRSASAAEFYFGENSTTSASSPVYFNPSNGQVDASLMPGDYELLTELQGFKISARLKAYGSNQFAVAPITSLAMTSSAANLSFGALIGPFPAQNFGNGASTLASNSAPHFGHFNPPPATGYVGLAVQRNSAIFYSWADITVNSDYTITLNAIGWDDSGGPIEAGIVTPEPASIVLLTLGAAGIAAYRRKQARLS
jgi:hypothetical protein